MNTTNKIILVLIILIIIGGAFWFVLNKLTNPKISISTVSASYTCNGGKTIDVVFTNASSTPSTVVGQPPVPHGSAAVKLSDGRSMTLPQTISADGVRYANADESFVFWSKGNGALVLENNQEKSYIGCIMVKSDPGGLPLVYENGSEGFSIRYPEGYKVDQNYKYQALGPAKTISGIKFSIPTSLTTGTNLSNDSYISVEQLPQTNDCTASLFLGPSASASKVVTEENTSYSLASSTDAAAGNRYEETVYALPGTNPCVAVRYFIHYGAIENYPAGAVTQFNRQSILNKFDLIRKTLVINQ